MIHSPKLEKFIQQHDFESCISFMREIFKFSYTKSRGETGVYIWLGDKDCISDSDCLVAHVEYCSFIFIDYTEDQIIEKYNKYYKLRGFL